MEVEESAGLGGKPLGLIILEEFLFSGPQFPYPWAFEEVSLDQLMGKSWYVTSDFNQSIISSNNTL